MLVKIAHQLTILISSQNTVKKFKRLASKTRLKMRKVQTVPRRKDHQAFNAVMMIVMKMLISLINFNRSIATKKILTFKCSTLQSTRTYRKQFLVLYSFYWNGDNQEWVLVVQSSIRTSSTRSRDRIERILAS